MGACVEFTWVGALLLATLGKLECFMMIFIIIKVNSLMMIVMNV
jgi:hypothetical protein